MTNYDTLKEYEAHKEPLPTYTQYIGLLDDSKELDKAYDNIKRLQEQNKKLQQQLQEANECIKDKYLWTCSACSLLGSCMSCGNRYFGRYIKKWGVK